MFLHVVSLFNVSRIYILTAWYFWNFKSVKLGSFVLWMSQVDLFLIFACDSVGII